MTLLTADNISKAFQDQIIFDKVSFSVRQGERIGLVGLNGSGKTTLFELLTRQMTVDTGVIHFAGKCKVDYIEQELTDYLDISLFDFVASARSDLLQLRKELRDVEHELELHPHNQQLLNRLGQLQTDFEVHGGFTFENEIKLVLEGLAFPLERHNERLRNFSGGEKNRAGLARALVGNGSLLLLDEPTNHLDIESTIWLEEYLSGSDRTYLAVSHDRAFLSKVAHDVWEIRLGKIDFYTGGFDKYLSERQERRRLHEHRYRHQQEEIKRIEEFIRRNMAGQKTKQAQSKLKYLNRINRLAPPQEDSSQLKVTVQSSRRSYAQVLTVNNVALGYGNNVVIEEASFEIGRGDRVGLIGRNGSGKTSLLRALIGELAPIDGEIKLGANVDVAYFDQELADLDPQLTVLNSVWELDPMVEGGVIRSFLARFNFTGDDSLKTVAALSGGEKTKLALARLLYYPANLLIFDEPTNHLDLDSREILEEALLEFDGSCLIVSHDRHFLDRVVNRIFYVNQKHVQSFDGIYSDFRETLTPATEAKPVKTSSSKESYLAFKEVSKQRSKLKKMLQSVKSRISDLEKELSRHERALHAEIPKSDWEKLQAASNRKREIEEQLLQLYGELETLEGSES